MINEKDFINKNGRLLYKMTCNKCGSDRGYKRKVLSKINALCRSCSQLGVENSYNYTNVNFADFINNNKSNKSYRTKCVQCNKDKGYVRKKDALKPCLSCAAVNRHKNMLEETKIESKIKISCKQRDIAIEDFKDFSTQPNERERDRFKTSGLREQCFEKADYTCDITGKKGCELNAHHLESWHSNEELRYDIDNLVCISKEMHDEFHRVYGRKNNTKEQYEEFKKSYFKEPSFLY